jgi:hypothetical protein
VTDRIQGFTVILDEDLRIDDMEVLHLKNAIAQLRGVLSVRELLADGITEATAEARVRADLGAKLLRVLYPTKETP